MSGCTVEKSGPVSTDTWPLYGAGPVKVLGNGDLKVALNVRVHKYTGSAAEKIKAAGGKAELIS